MKYKQLIYEKSKAFNKFAPHYTNTRTYAHTKKSNFHPHGSYTINKRKYERII